MARVGRALLSVSDKTGLVAFARGLVELGVTLVSTGGTARALAAAGLEATPVDAVTGFREILDGRVKTLHPAVHAGILARRDHPGDVSALAELGIDPIDLVVVNLYPFRETVARPGVSPGEAVEQIDIGGPAMVRAAAKNHAHVGVVTRPEDYEAVLGSLRQHDGTLPDDLRLGLAAAAFAHTASYDAAVATFLARRGEGRAVEPMPPSWGAPFVRQDDLRYGENPHQAAALYTDGARPRGLVAAAQLQGKQLSYNNWMDLDAARALARDLGPSGIAILKHANPCGAARSDGSLADAYRLARECDPVSAFGGVVATRGIVDEALAELLTETFLEVVLAGGVTAGARSKLGRKSRLRVLELGEADWLGGDHELVPRPIAGGFLVQQADRQVAPLREARVVTARPPTDDEWAALELAWTLVRHVKSNAIVFAAADRAVGIGAGQMSRVDAVRIAIDKARYPLAGTAVGSDAFFPFPDGVVAAAEAGATAVVQPGGSIRDDEVIAAADEHGLAMLMTGHRHFRH